MILPGGPSLGAGSGAHAAGRGLVVGAHELLRLPIREQLQLLSGAGGLVNDRLTFEVRGPFVV